MALSPWLLMSNNTVTISISIITVALAGWFIRRQRQQLPPGPWLWPLIGYLPLLKCKDKRELFRQLRVKYGNLVYLRVGSQPILLVSGREMIHEVLVKKTREFEGRPQVFTTLKPGQGKGVVNSSGSVWREHRSFLVSKMNGLGIGKTSFEEHVYRETGLFLDALKSTKGEPMDSRFLIQTAMSNIICSISFGKRFNYDQDEFVKILKLIENNMKLVGATSFVNYFPFLEYLPGDFFKCKECLVTVDKVQKMTREWVENHEATLNPHEPRDMIDSYLVEMRLKQESNKTLMDKSQLIKLVGDLLVAGAETTATTLQWTLLFLAGHLEVQQHVYEEIFANLGNRDYLSLQDKDSTPYTIATIFESQRLADIAPFSLPHSNLTTVLYVNGYSIPEGTLVLPVLNSVHHDADLWENPMDFRPDRFLDAKKQKVVNFKEIIPYSLGSRACPGRSLAFMELYCFLTSIVQHFHILPENGDKMFPLEGHLGVTYMPKEYMIKFVPRSAETPLQ